MSVGTAAEARLRSTMSPSSSAPSRDLAVEAERDESHVLLSPSVVEPDQASVCAILGDPEAGAQPRSPREARPRRGSPGSRRPDRGAQLVGSSDAEPGSRHARLRAARGAADRGGRARPAPAQRGSAPEHRLRRQPLRSPNPGRRLADPDARSVSVRAGAGSGRRGSRGGRRGRLDRGGSPCDHHHAGARQRPSDPSGRLCGAHDRGSRCLCRAAGRGRSAGRRGARTRGHDRVRGATPVRPGGRAPCPSDGCVRRRRLGDRGPCAGPGSRGNRRRLAARAHSSTFARSGRRR